MKTEDLVRLEFGRLHAYIGSREIEAPIKNDLVRLDIRQALYERAIQADYNISAYLSQMKLAGKDTTALEQEFNQLRAQCPINFPKEANK